MIKHIVNTILVLSITSCSSLPKYIPPTNGDLSRIELERTFETEMPLAGSSTIINKYKVKDTSKCFQEMGILDAKKFITITDSNPFISEFNPNGTNVKSEEQLILQATTISGPISCISYVEFTPHKNMKYKLKLSGAFTGLLSECKAELWAKRKTQTKYKKQKLQILNAC